MIDALYVLFDSKDPSAPHKFLRETFFDVVKLVVGDVAVAAWDRDVVPFIGERELTPSAMYDGWDGDRWPVFEETLRVYLGMPGKHEVNQALVGWKASHERWYCTNNPEPSDLHRIIAMAEDDDSGCNWDRGRL